MKRKYVLRSRESKSSFAFLHSDKEDLSFQLCDLDNAMKFSKEEITFILEKLPKRFESMNLQIFEVECTLGKSLSACIFS
jgi:hypothetical protein